MNAIIFYCFFKTVYKIYIFYHKIYFHFQLCLMLKNSKNKKFTIFFIL